MSKQNVVVATLIFVAGVLASLLSVAAQDGQQGAPKPPQDVLIERDVIITAPRASMAHPPMMPPEVVMATPGDGFEFAFISSEMSFDSTPVKNAPYSAEAVTEMIQVLGDGNRIVRKTTAAVYRDSEGRTRRDQTLGAIGPFATAGDPPQTVLINDPVAGVNYILDPKNRTARKLMLPPLHFGPVIAPDAPDAPLPLPSPGKRLGRAPEINKLEMPQQVVVKKVEPVYPATAKAAGAQGLVRVQVMTNQGGEVETATALDGHALLQPAAVEAVKQWRFKPAESSEGAAKMKSTIAFQFVLPANADGPAQVEGTYIGAAHGESVNESLGKQTIEGVLAEGTRSTFTIPENAIGNERPIKIVNERWFSPDLQTVVMTKRSDPRFGETVYRLTNINRSEPSNTLFEVPADYTLKEMPGGIRTIRRSRQ